MEFELVVGSNVDISSLVLGTVTILGGGKDSDALSIVLFLITFHSHFMTANNGSQIVVLTESLGDIWSELHSYTSLARSSAWFCLWIGP